jgi:hypothetical protein
MVTIILRKPWQGPDTTSAQSLLEEAVIEIAEEHPLNGRLRMLLARTSASDHALFELDDGKVAKVHLTWSRKPERLPWPSHTIFSNVEEWANHEKMILTGD